MSSSTAKSLRTYIKINDGGDLVVVRTQVPRSSTLFELGECDLHAGALVFIPATSWVSARNIGSEPVYITFVFSAPGFEDTMRCNSVPTGETPTEITPEQQAECAHLGMPERDPARTAEAAEPDEVLPD